jgi:hypothetical protein
MADSRLAGLRTSSNVGLQRSGLQRALLAFKSRAAISGHAWNMWEGDAVPAGESASLCTVFEAQDGALPTSSQPLSRPQVVTGLADRGTCLEAQFYLQAGVRIFVSVRDLGRHARLLDAESSGEVKMIGDQEARELLPSPRGFKSAVWEFVSSFPPAHSVRSLDFAVFASYVSNPGANLPSLGISRVFGCSAPVEIGGPISSLPVFQVPSTPPCNIIAIVP